MITSIFTGIVSKKALYGWFSKMNIQTSNGVIHIKKEFPSLHQRIDENKMLENIQILQLYLDKTGIEWGPAFETLIGIVRYDNFLPKATAADFFILKEDEERFKDVLHLLFEIGFKLVRYERRGLYCLVRNTQWMTFYILRKISPDIRHSGGSHFLFDKYLHQMVKWDFKGIPLNVPAQLDEYLTFQYGDWIHSLKATERKINSIEQLKWRIKDILPDCLYYPLILRHHKKDFAAFKSLCVEKGLNVSENVELSYIRPRKNKKVLTVGVYDLLHKGHVELYRRAKGLGDYLIVAAQDSDFILKYKPTAKVLNSTEDRMYMIKSIRYVDEVVVYTDVDKIVKEIDFDVFVTGPDQCHAGFQRAIEWCITHGKEHVVLARTDGVSSSELKAKISSKIMEKQ